MMTKSTSKRCAKVAWIVTLFALVIMGTGHPAFAEQVNDLEVLDPGEVITIDEDETPPSPGVINDWSDSTEGSSESDTPGKDDVDHDVKTPLDIVQKINITETTITLEDQIFTGQPLDAVISVAYGEGTTPLRTRTTLMREKLQ